jgi:predicted SprT family Zn-dependent metalloprotease
MNLLPPQRSSEQAGEGEVSALPRHYTCWNCGWTIEEEDRMSPYTQTWYRCSKCEAVNDPDFVKDYYGPRRKGESAVPECR